MEALESQKGEDKLWQRRARCAAFLGHHLTFSKDVELTDIENRKRFATIQSKPTWENHNS